MVERKPEQPRRFTQDMARYWSRDHVSYLCAGGGAGLSIAELMQEHDSPNTVMGVGVAMAFLVRAYFMNKRMESDLAVEQNEKNPSSESRRNIRESMNNLLETRCMSTASGAAVTGGLVVAVESSSPAWGVALTAAGTLLSNYAEEKTIRIGEQVIVELNKPGGPPFGYFVNR